LIQMSILLQRQVWVTLVTLPLLSDYQTKIVIRFKVNVLNTEQMSFTILLKLCASFAEPLESRQ